MSFKGELGAVLLLAVTDVTEIFHCSSFNIIDLSSPKFKSY